MMPKVFTAAYSKSTREHHVDHRARINAEANTINTGDGGSNQSTQNFVVTLGDDGSLVTRKLTVNECEKAMGWRPDWTRFGRREDGTVYELPKSARYKACGNGVVSSIPRTVLNAVIRENDVRVFSTFAGVDGSSMYLDAPKFIKVAFSEFDPKTKEQHPSNVLRYHYPEVPNLGDITKIREEDVPDHDLMFISAPCQSFSSAGSRAGFEDTRGTLFYETARILKYKKPKYFFFENVKGLLTHDEGNTFLTMLRVYSDLGYSVDFELLNSRDFGVAQVRERVFMIGVLA